MKVILLQDIPSIGKIHDVKNVSDGYASNFLIPKKLVKPATPAAIEELKKLQAQHEGKLQLQENLLVKNIEAAAGVSVEIRVAANEQGHLFKGIHREDIVKALKEQKRIELPAESITLEHALKEIGEFSIDAHLDDRTVSFTVIISPEK